MKEQWRKLSERFAALQPRERIIILIAAVAGTALLFDTLSFQPAEARKKTLERQIKQARDQVKSAETIMKSKETVGDSRAVKRTYRDALRGRLAEFDQNLRNLQEGMVPPEQMAKLLEGVLARIGGLQLVSLRALPPSEFEPGRAGSATQPGGKPPGKPAANQPDGRIYQHSFEITLQGSYGDMYEYLARLEKLPWQMFYSRINIRTEQHPRLQMTLTVKTLSLAKAWLIV